MKKYLKNLSILSLFLLMALAGCNTPTKSKNVEKSVYPENPQYYAGIRRSSYGFDSKNSDDYYWANKAIKFSESFNDDQQPVQPLIIEIISVNDGKNAIFGFDKPSSYSGSTENILFGQGEIDHLRALNIYYKTGVKAIIQFESGNADLLDCIQIAMEKFGDHPAIAGYGIDAEWYFSAEHNEGKPVSDESAQKWMNKIKNINENYVLFVKHWEEKHMPPTYRHEDLWFLDDSQNFRGKNHLIEEFSQWGENFNGYNVGFQYGYPVDENWWKSYTNPADYLAKELIQNIPNAKYFFWVDFSIDKVYK